MFMKSFFYSPALTSRRLLIPTDGSHFRFNMFFYKRIIKKTYISTFIEVYNTFSERVS